VVNGVSYVNKTKRYYAGPSRGYPQGTLSQDNYKDGRHFAVISPWYLTNYPGRLSLAIPLCGMSTGDGLTVMDPNSITAVLLKTRLKPGLRPFSFEQIATSGS